MPDQEPTQEVPVHVANAARVQYINSHLPPGAPRVPVEQMIQTSLLEFLILAATGEQGLAEARAYHENRVAVILDAAVANLTRMQEANASAQARQILLEGITFR